MKVNQLFNEKYVVNFGYPRARDWVLYNLNHRRKPTYKTWVDENTIIKRVKLPNGFSDMVFTNRKNCTVRFHDSDIRTYFKKL